MLACAQPSSLLQSPASGQGLCCHWSFECKDTAFPWSPVGPSDSGSGRPPTEGHVAVMCLSLRQSLLSRRPDHRTELQRWLPWRWTQDPHASH